MRSRPPSGCGALIPRSWEVRQAPSSYAGKVQEGIWRRSPACACDQSPQSVIRHQVLLQPVIDFTLSFPSMAMSAHGMPGAARGLGVVLPDLWW